MQIHFDNTSVSFDLVESDLSPIYRHIISHLRHIDIPFRPWDNPYKIRNPVTHLIEFANRIGITVDQRRCEQKEQEYFNFLHRMYEKNYAIDPNPAWLDFHEHIHLCESSIRPPDFLHIDYRNKAGPLEKPFDMAWLVQSTIEVKAGDIFVHWSELGKTPYRYWADKEPNNINRIKELCKPWIKLRPKILVALQDYEYSESCFEFEQWWKEYHDEWCQHWNIPKWDLTDMRSVLVFGKMSLGELQKLTTLLMEDHCPRRITL